MPAAPRRLFPVVLLVVLPLLMGSGEKGCTPQEEPARYPIVLLHGQGGFVDILGINYYYGVQDDLRERGYVVYSPGVAALGSVEGRARELAPQIDAILAETGAAKVNLVGHSMGGLDARYLISTMGYGDRVASLSTMSSPHHGSVVADIVHGLIPGPQQELIDILVDDLNWSVDTLRDVTTSYTTEQFNPANPDDPRVYYQSWAGVTGILEGDIPNVILAPIAAIHRPFDGPNDGMVSSRSARWGDFHGTVPADHYAEVGHPLGLNGLFQHDEFFRDLARDLRDMGF